ncbi:SRPBCC domain-containing protein [Micromonospora globispora]|nr:SRPBCC domain-containing protein [Micromonospora globispora]
MPAEVFLIRSTIDRADASSGKSYDVRALGTLRAADGKGIVRLEDRFDTDMDDLWSALTDPRRLARWLGEVEGDLRQGGEFRARYFASGWEGTGRVEECEPPRWLLILTKSPDEPDGVIEATLTADGDQTILVIEDRGLPLQQIAAYGAGNQVHVEDLAAYLAGRERCNARERWQELHPAYQELAAHLT